MIRTRTAPSARLWVYPSGIFILVEETGKVGTSIGELFWKQRVGLGFSSPAMFWAPPRLLELQF